MSSFELSQETVSIESFRQEVAQSIIAAAEKSTTLSRGEKRRIDRVMKGGWFQEGRKNQIINAVVQQLHAEQAIVVLPDGVQAAVDWDAVIEFIEKLIPLIVKLISLFGG